jgi:hypothetical protein
MGKVTQTITICTCDRCGAQHKEADYMSGNQWGQLSLSWTGDKGGRAYDGSAGGINLLGKAWLCLSCTDAFFEFMEPVATKEA